MQRLVSLLPALAVVVALVGVGSAPATATTHKAAADQTPLAVTIDTLTPSVVPLSAKGEVRVTGEVTNRDTQTWRDVKVYAFASATPMTTTTELVDAAATPETQYVGDRILTEGTYASVDELAPGETAQYSISVPRDELPTEPGVYWFGVHALGYDDAGGDNLADGRARTFLPLVPRTRRTVDTALVLPVRHGVSHAADGSLQGVSRWRGDLAPGGALHALVGLGAAAGPRPVTWLLDPAVVDAARRLAAGNPPRSIGPTALRGGDADADGAGDPAGSGSSDAASPSASPSGDADPDDVPTAEEKVAATVAATWLRQLRAGLTGHEVLALPYGDVDLAGAAQHEASAYRDARKRSDDVQLWGLPTRPAVASPTGYLDGRAVALASSDTTVLLTDKMFDGPAPAVVSTAGRTVGVTSSAAVSGGPGPGDPMDPLAERQRILSEAAVRLLAPGDEPLIAVLPSSWTPDSSPGFWSGLDQPWLHLTTVDDAMQRLAVPVPFDRLDYPGSQRALELDASSFGAAAALADSGETLQNLLTQNDTVATEVRDESFTDVSYATRLRPELARASADRSRGFIEDQLQSVHVDAPKAVILSSGSGRFSATVTNDLEEPVSVRLRALTDPPLRVSVPGETIDLGPGSRTTVLLRASSSAVGIRTLTLQLTDVEGVPLGSTDEVPIRSNRVSNVIWLILGTGVALLVGAIVVRLVRRIRAARRSA
ncbi:DUF6049 family protein [Nocardioides sp.]|uniref:DUF6049 family protein n=1 Tax=Nocardioides sp. TaxID=35761 RepID=UPI0037839523